MSKVRISPGIFLASFSVISFEIALTRIFSISLGYHFAFMIVSMAMLGIGLGGTVLSVKAELKKADHLGIYALGLAVTFIIGYAGTNLVPLEPARIAWDREQMIFLGTYYLLLSAPFIFFGMIMVTALAVNSERAFLIYGADLLGAGAGSAAAVFIMSGFGPETSLIFISATAALSALVLGRRRSSVAMLIVIMVVALADSDFMKIRMSQYRGLVQALRYPGAGLLKTYYSGFSRVDIFESPGVRFAPGMSLKFMGDLPRQAGISVDGAGVNAVTDASGDLRFLHFLPASLPYEIMPRERVLVVEPAGGLHVLLAREYGSSLVEKAESDPLVADVVRRDFGALSGGIYDRKSHGMLARSFLLNSDELFDLIDISLTAAEPSGGFGIAEDYGLTVNAFRQYLMHLSGAGLISFTAYIIPPPRTGLRFLSTAAEALRETGIEDVRSHIAAIRSWGVINILIKRRVFSLDELDSLKSFAAERNFDLVYYPGISEEEANRFNELSEAEYFRAFKEILRPDAESEFIRDYIFDISPVYDDAPFFHYFLKLKKLKEAVIEMGGKWQFIVDEGYLLPFVFLQVITISLIILLIPALKRPLRSGPVSLLAYFALLGTGFMFVELPIIQMMILPMGNPSYAMAAVLASMLIWSGAGGLLSLRYTFFSRPGILILIAAAVALAAFYLPSLAAGVSGFQTLTKLCLSFIMMMPVAILMGIPFPMGIRLAGKRFPGMIPWAWAVNGCLSVMAPLLAESLALQWGFRTVILLGAVSYVLAYGMLRIQIPGLRPE